MSSTSAARTLRESFGDRKIPDISRKITACVACRKLKIKCHMTDGKPPCTRCRARGLGCTLNKSLQALLEGDATWKEIVEQRLARVEELLHVTNDAEVISAEVPASLDVPTSTQLIPTDKASLNLSGSLGAFPASSIIDLAVVTPKPSLIYHPDLISCGAISLESAKTAFDFYKNELDPYINFVLAQSDTLAGVRARSSILTAAISTVAAFCAGLKEYQACLKAYTDEVSRKFFADKYSFDDVRALCIGAFWLSEISSALNGLAVRIGTQLDLHRCITKMPHTKYACYERTRLYFLVFLCDHHCSLIYGRPPMTTEFRSLKGPGAFLRSQFSTQLDMNLICQVEFWSLNRRVFDLFGSDIQSTIVSQRFAELERLNTSFDQWYQDWGAFLKLRDEPMGTKQRIFDFYFHSAKLYLFSHIFRGPLESGVPTMIAGTESMAQKASENALYVLRCAVDGDKGYDWLKKLPYYFGTMIAFAAVCLIRTTLQDAPAGDARANETLSQLRKVSEVLRQSSMPEESSHPLLSIARSLEAAIRERQPRTTSEIDDFDAGNWPDLTFDFDAFASDPLNLAFPGGEDNWMLCPEQMPDMVL